MRPGALYLIMESEVRWYYQFHILPGNSEDIEITEYQFYQPCHQPRCKFEAMLSCISHCLSTFPRYYDADAELSYLEDKTIVFLG